MPNKKLKKTDVKDLVEKKNDEMNEEEEDEDQSSSGQEEKGDDQDESMSSDDEDDDSNDDAEAADQNEEIMIDFEARAPLESDLQSVRLLVQQKLAAFPSLNLNDIARIIVQQENIGNVIYQVQGDGQEEDEKEEESEETKKAAAAEEDETIFGVLSLIDLQSTQCKAFANTFTQFLLNECQKYDKSHKNNRVSEKLSTILKSKRVSYVVNERFINVPPGISIPMFESLLSDLSGGKEAEVKPVDSDYWLFISKLYNECEDSVHGKSSKSSKSKAQQQQEQVIYANPEEEVFEEFSELKFEISYGDRASKSSAGNWSANDPDLLPILNVLLVPCDKVQTVLNKVKSLI